MNIKQFDKLTHRDFENGAVLGEIRETIKVQAELLAALKYVTKELEASGLCYDHPTITRLRKWRLFVYAAIAKAEGGK